MEYDKLIWLYLAVVQELYALYAPLVYGNEGDPVLDTDRVQERQDIPDDPEYPGEGPTYDNINPENNVKIWDTWEQKHVLYWRQAHEPIALQIVSFPFLARNSANF